MAIGKLIAVGGAEDKGTDLELGVIQRNNLNFFEQAPNTVQLLNNDNVFPIGDQNGANEVINGHNPNRLIYVQAGTEFNDEDNSILKSISSQYKTHEEFHVPEIYIVHLFNR